MGGAKTKDLRFMQVFKWGVMAENWPILTPKWGEWRGMDLNHQPRAYEAYSCLSPPSIPKTKLFAFSFGRAGLNPLDFSEVLVNATRPNSKSTSKIAKSIKIPVRVSETLSYCKRIK